MTKRELAFCREYVKERNIERAAIAAGYAVSYAKTRACQLLAKDRIRNEIARLTEKVAEVAEARSLMTATDLIGEFSRVAEFDYTSFIKPHPLYPEQRTFLAPDELSEEQKKVIKNIRIHKHYSHSDGHFVCETYSYEFMDRERAMENLARHYGIFDSKAPQTRRDNPFEGMSTQKVVKIRSFIAQTMAEPEGDIIEGESSERKPNGRTT